jgi:hypothetical protein
MALVADLDYKVDRAEVALVRKELLFGRDINRDLAIDRRGGDCVLEHLVQRLLEDIPLGVLEVFVQHSDCSANHEVFISNASLEDQGLLLDELLESHVSGHFPELEDDVDFPREIELLRKGAVALNLVAGRPRTCQLSLKLAQLPLNLLFAQLWFSSLYTDQTLGV